MSAGFLITILAGPSAQSVFNAILQISSDDRLLSSLWADVQRSRGVTEFSNIVLEDFSFSRGGVISTDVMPNTLTLLPAARFVSADRVEAR